MHLRLKMVKMFYTHFVLVRLILVYTLYKMDGKL